MNGIIQEENKTLKAQVFELTQEKDDIQMNFDLDKEEQNDQIEAMKSSIKGYQKLKEDLELKIKTVEAENQKLLSRVTQIKQEVSSSTNEQN